jgi:C4-dicarboxylate transporter DctQ subunit
VHRLKLIIDRLEEGLMALLLAGMTILTALQVLLRYVFNSGFVWSLEATSYSFAWLVLLGISYGVRTRSHIAVELVVGRLSGSKRKIVSLLALCICLAYAGLMCFGSAVFIQKLFVLGNEARDIPLARWILTIILPLGFALLASRFVGLAFQMWKSGDWSLGFAGKEEASILRGESAQEKTATEGNRAP